jgi:predicted anti-sigma-YlaC factor YlaD
VPDPYEVDDEGNPAVEAEPAVDPSAEEAAMRRQIEQTLRFMRLQTTLGIVVIIALIIFVSSIRGVMVVVGIIFAFSSLGAYWWLRRSLNARLGGSAPRA